MSDNDSDNDSEMVKEVRPTKKYSRSSNILAAIFSAMCCAVLIYFSVWLTFYPDEKGKLTSLLAGIFLWIMSFGFLCMTLFSIYNAMYNSTEHVKVQEDDDDGSNQ